jgi:hypothetical protein
MVADQATRKYKVEESKSERRQNTSIDLLGVIHNKN